MPSKKETENLEILVEMTNQFSNIADYKIQIKSIPFLDSSVED